MKKAGLHLYRNINNGKIQISESPSKWPEREHCEQRRSTHTHYSEPTEIDNKKNENKENDVIQKVMH